MKKGRRLNEVQIQDILKKTPKIPIKVLGTDAKGVPSKQVAICTKRKDGEMPNE